MAELFLFYPSTGFGGGVQVPLGLGCYVWATTTSSDPGLDKVLSLPSHASGLPSSKINHPAPSPPSSPHLSAPWVRSSASLGCLALTAFIPISPRLCLSPYLTSSLMLHNNHTLVFLLGLICLEKPPPWLDLVLYCFFSRTLY